MKVRCTVGLSVVTLLVLGALAGPAYATGPGGWDHVGHGAAVGTASLNGPAVSALNADDPSKLYVGGSFTTAGSISGADYIASWNGSNWSTVGSPGALTGLVKAIAYDPVTHDVFAGGTFTIAGGSPANFLAVWNGVSWAPFCAPITANVNALKIIDRTLYVGGDFADGAGIPSADFLVACNIDNGAASSTVDSEVHAFSGGIRALTASNGTLYAGGGFSNLGGDPAADNVAYLDGSGVGWHAMGTGGGSCSCALNGFVDSLTAIGPNVYVGSTAIGIGGINQADHVARWNGSWNAVGANTAADDGWFPLSASIYGLTNDGTNIYATGSFQNANGDPTADDVAKFDGTAWHPVGSDGAGNGPWGNNGLALAFWNQRLFAGGGFTSAGGDTQAKYLAAYPGYYQLTVVFAGTGTGYIQTQQLPCRATCSQSYPPGTMLTLGAANDILSRFDGWSGAGCAGTFPCQVTMNADTTVTVTFTAIPYCSNFAGYAATGGVPVQLKLACRDNGNPITYSIVSGPSHGTLGPLYVLYADTRVDYTPTVGYTGPDQIEYTGTDVNGVAAPKPVSINVVDPGYAQAYTNFSLLSATFTASADGALSIGAHNANTFAVTATSVKITSLSAVAATAGAHKKVVTFLKSSKKVAIKAKKSAKLKGRVKGARLAQLKRLRKVRVRITVVLKTPKGIRSTFKTTGTLRAPK
jgi:hypothetical protein